ncbi:LysR family transcriptional regulator [Chitinimonas arctica]|uniref:LysR family transcriptional regulator n=1 Tax=Chitinimonas arctica TaxID=2594795 RepID=A0A516SFQ8_9NEIS|nr:LysR family transcriptional regulator [Chitinimonas arctica]QDQ26868.1 LysR family transcriptional regulator [Chitinimonas arctica]
MNDLKPYAVFAEVVAAGSMSAAARRLGLTPSAVSQTISALERQSGVNLLHRSTRRLTLTEAGERCYPHCLRLLQAANAAAESLERARDAPSGELRIAAPLGFGAHVAPALAPVLAEWPQLRLSLIVDDALINLIDSRIDIALRVGELPDSSWIGRKLCDMETVLCASPAYLERHGTPVQAADLVSHHWLALMHEVRNNVALATIEDNALPTFSLELIDQHEKRKPVTLRARTTTTNQIALRQMCEQGMGIARLFYADVQPVLEQGLLIRVLPKTRLPSLDLTMLTAKRDEGPAKVSIAVAALRRHFASLTQVP